MYQYTILIQHKNDCPFHVDTFDYFDVALISLNNYIKDDKHFIIIFMVIVHKINMNCFAGKWANGNILNF